MPPKKRNENNVEGKRNVKKDKTLQDGNKNEWDELDLETLQKRVQSMKEQLDEFQKQRRYVQVECDTLQQYYDITLQSIQEVEIKTQLKELEQEQLQQEHDMEIRAYQNKATYLQYELVIALQDVKDDDERLLEQVLNERDAQLIDLLHAKRLKEEELHQMELHRNVELRKFKEDTQKSFEALQKQLSDDLESIKGDFRVRQTELEQELLLQLMMEKHDTCERKNFFLQELSQRHKECIQHMKSYYNGITTDQLDKITALRTRIAASREKRDDAKQTTQVMANENCQLVGPLACIQEEVAQLKAKQKNRETDLKTLHNTKKRIAATKKRITELEQECSNLQETFTKVEKERDDLIRRFDETALKANQTSICKSSVLEKKIEELTNAVEIDEEQLHRVLNAASLAPNEVETISAMLRNDLEGRNRRIHQLQLNVARASKDYNEYFVECRMGLRNQGLDEAGVTRIVGEPVAV